MDHFHTNGYRQHPRQREGQYDDIKNNINKRTKLLSNYITHKEGESPPSLPPLHQQNDKKTKQLPRTHIENPYMKNLSHIQI